MVNKKFLVLLLPVLFLIGCFAKQKQKVISTTKSHEIRQREVTKISQSSEISQRSKINRRTKKSSKRNVITVIDDNVKNNWLSAKKCTFVQNIGELYKKLSKLYPPKGKFEKTEDYIRRITRIRQPIYCISIDPKEYDLTYDPDSEMLNFEIEFDIYQEQFNTKRVCCIPVKRILLEKREHIAQNAFGATVTVYTSCHKVYALCFKNTKEIGGDSFIWYKRQIKIPLKKAKVLFDKPKEWKLIIAFTPKPICLEHEFLSNHKSIWQLPTFECTDYIRPTYSLPFEEFTEVKGINASVVRIWLYNPVKHKLIILYSSK